MGVYMVFKDLYKKIEELKSIEGVDFFEVGKSLLGQSIFGAHVGNFAGPQIFIEGAIHAREYVTALLIVEMVKYYANLNFNGGIYFVPLVNPDGVRLVLDGASWLPCGKFRDYILSLNNYSNDFSLWKANGEGVDLNVNFDALWGRGVQNVFCPASGNFVGFYPNSEREVRALIEFMQKTKIDLSLSYHTKGEVIYYGFEVLSDEALARDYAFASTISNITGYPIIKTTGSVGGFSDWVSLNFDIPAFTIEVGSNDIPHPIGEEYLSEIFERNKDVPLALINQLNEGL